jgi:hypothetical protein
MADHSREQVRRIDDRSDEGVRTRRLIAFVNDDLEAIVQDIVGDFRIFVGRQDYLFLCLGLLADRRHPVPMTMLDDLVAYFDERELPLPLAQARRLRGLINGDRSDLESALSLFEAMAARPFVARVQTELGLRIGDTALIDRGLDGLEAIGDVDQATRVATERRAGSLTSTPTG